MARRTYDCQHCGDLFASTTDHLIHVTLAHEPRRVGDPRPAPLVRGWICCSCVREVAPTQERCSCGSERPWYVTREISCEG